MYALRDMSWHWTNKEPEMARLCAPFASQGHTVSIHLQEIPSQGDLRVSLVPQEAIVEGEERRLPLTLVIGAMYSECTCLPVVPLDIS